MARALSYEIESTCEAFTAQNIRLASLDVVRKTVDRLMANGAQIIEIHGVRLVPVKVEGAAPRESRSVMGVPVSANGHAAP